MNKNQYFFYKRTEKTNVADRLDEIKSNHDNCRKWGGGTFTSSIEGEGKNKNDFTNSALRPTRSASEQCARGSSDVVSVRLVDEATVTERHGSRRASPREHTCLSDRVHARLGGTTRVRCTADNEKSSYEARATYTWYVPTFFSTPPTPGKPYAREHIVMARLIFRR